MLRRLSGYEKFMVVAFVVSLPLCNPWVRGDGIGYYAYARALLIDHNLRFEKDYLAGNPNFINSHVDSSGHINPKIYTVTGHLDNHFSIGPAILWAPFLITAHLCVLAARTFGASVTFDGYSFPYRAAMALGTAVYGFLALWISFQLAKKYCDERWAFLATLGIWWGTSLPVYMYFNPSWSHAHSAFSVALFLWYWHRTRDKRNLAQWILLGLLAGLMINVYYLNALLLTAPATEALQAYRGDLRAQEKSWAAATHLLGMHFVFGLVTLVALAPTFITRAIIYGDPLESGYIHTRDWLWRTPAWGAVLFSSNHGLFAWTPILILSVIGLVLFCWRDKELGGAFLGATLVFYIFISAYPNWDGMASFGNRFFISLSPLFVFGLAITLQQAASWLARERLAYSGAVMAMGLFIAWNLGFIFQWGTHLVPVRGPISWRDMAYNQVAVVPVRLAGNIHSYLFKRKTMMERIEQQDAQQLGLQKKKDPD